MENSCAGPRWSKMEGSGPAEEGVIPEKPWRVCEAPPALSVPSPEQTWGGAEVGSGGKPRARGQAGSSCSPDLSKPTAAPLSGGHAAVPWPATSQAPRGCHPEVTLLLPRGGPRPLLSGTRSPALRFCVWWGRDLRVVAGPRVSHVHSSCRLGRRTTGPACPTTVRGRCSCSSC